MRRLALILLVGLLLAPQSASAQSCSFGVSNLNLGNVDTLAGAPVDATATVSITCGGAALGATVRVCLNLNAGSGGATGGIRHMLSGTQQLDYQLYQNAARTTPWGSREQPALGDPVPVDLTLPLLGGSTSTTRTIYGRVFGSQQAVPPGSYASVFSGAEVSFNWTAYLLVPPSCGSITANSQRPSFTAMANVIPNCTVTAQDIDFGSQGVLTADVDATGGLDVTCTPGTSYTVGLNNGLNGDGPATRRMTLGGETVVYGLYQDPARSQPWGDTAGTLLSGTGAGTAQGIPVYGRVPAQTTPSPGTYSDTVVVTVTY